MVQSDAVLDAAIIGAGWAGLGVAYELRRRGFSQRTFERGRIAETWRTQRWDNFYMNTPNRLTVMPGDRYEGSDPDGYLTRDEFVALLVDYARRRDLRVEEETPVTSLVRGESGTFTVTTPRETIRARHVVVASGSLNHPVRPAWAGALPATLEQLDASTYRSAAALPQGEVLVVGNAQSGGQIAEDLALAGRRVYLATSRVGRAPRRYRGADFGQWMATRGVFEAPREQFLKPDGSIVARPLIGARHTISLQSLAALGVELLGRLQGYADGRLLFGDEAAENVRFGDAASAKLKQQIDDYILRTGMVAPAAEPDPAETVPLRLPDPPVAALDISELAAIIWCTGFVGDFGYMHIPGALNERGQPVHVDGVAPIPGLFFAGLDLSSTRLSGTILALADEAAALVDRIAGGG